MRFLCRRRSRRGFLASTTGDTQPGQTELWIWNHIKMGSRIRFPVKNRIRIHITVKRQNWIRIKIKIQKLPRAVDTHNGGVQAENGTVKAENKAVGGLKWSHGV
jgi:hypothetical protein